MNALLKRCVFNLYLNRVCLNPEGYQEGYSKVREPNPPLVDFAILGTTKSPDFCILKECDVL